MKQQQQYKSIRIYPKDYEKLRRLSYFQDKPIIKLVSESVELMEEEHKAKK